MSIFVENVSKRFATGFVLDRVDLTIPTGSIGALSGISGSGKTTLTRLLAGLETPDSGRIEMDSPPVYAHPVPFRKFTVRENIAFGLQIRHRSKKEIQAKVEDVLRFFHLQELQDSYPDQLSAGHRHRISLGRVMAVEPPILLLDEPFDRLDPLTRRRFSFWLREQADRFHSTILLTTRHFGEVMAICDSLIVLHEGRIAQEYAPIEPYDLLALQTSLDLEERIKESENQDYSFI